MRLTFAIPGEPQAWQRVGWKGSRTFNPSAPYEKTVRQYADLAIREAHRTHELPSTQRFAVHLVFFLGRDGNNRQRDCDLDNLVKIVLDALTGTVWRNDSQVQVLNASKHKGDAETLIYIEAVGL